MAKILAEICCGSPDDAYTAKAAGADRIELNAALSLGGLTPSMGTFLMVKEIGLEVMVMVRPRSGGFLYSAAEFETMRADVRLFREAGADGIVFGILRPDGTVDAERCAEILRLAGELPCIFHRAFDGCPDWRDALDTLGGLGFRRILSGGGRENAWDGRETLGEMREYAAGRIEILPGGGIRSGNIRALIGASGCTQVHFSRRKSGSPDELMNAAELRELIALARG